MSRKMTRKIDSNMPRKETTLRPNQSVAAAMPAMPESPIPDWGQGNRTPDPLARPLRRQPRQG